MTFSGVDGMNIFVQIFGPENTGLPQEKRTGILNLEQNLELTVMQDLYISRRQKMSINSALIDPRRTPPLLFSGHQAHTDESLVCGFL
jgi:hypothetical protein